MRKKKILEPEIGQKIYVPGAIYVYRGEDDFAGGLATISKIERSKYVSKDDINYLMIEIEERPGVMYNWKLLCIEQDKLKKQYEGQIAHPDPDYREEFNQPDADWH